MSEYHSFSLVEHLPASRSTKKNASDQQQQQQQQQHKFSHHTFDIQTPNQFSSNNSNKHDILSMEDNTDQMIKSDDWSSQSNSFQGFDSILNNMPNYSNHARHHTAPVNSNDYQNLFEFLPFDDTSHNLMVSNEGNDDHSRHNNEYNSPGSSNNNSMQHGIQLQDSNSVYVNRDAHTKDKNSSMDKHNTDSGSNSIHAITGFNDHESNLFSFNHNETDKPRTIMPYYDPMDNNPKETSLMNSHLNTSFTSPATSSPSPTATQSSSPAYRISNLSLVQQPIQTPSILEFQPSTPSRISSSVSSRMMQGMVNATKMKPAIQAYLGASDPLEAGERTVIIMTSKVAQKSYGTEKRFLCPPPTTILVGSSWWTPPSISKQQSEGAHLQNASFRDRDNVLRAPPNLTICISGESTGHQSGRIEWYSSSGTLVGQTGSTSNQKLIQPVTNPKKPAEPERESKSSANDDWYRNTRKESVAGGRCVLKRLYINDADEKRKKVECLIKVQLANGLMLGTLSSRGIKVISKPSKKRQSVKNIELCIYHGTTVSLFNRIRSQTVSTKYLGVSSTSGESSLFDYPGRIQSNNMGPPNSDTCFVARTGSWDPFIVWVVDPSHHGQSEGYNASGRADEYIGCPSLVPTIPYPNPPTIALKNQTNQPLAIRYNQHIVLQCLTTGLVSPVMIIRKVDKASTVVGGARCPDEIDPSFSGGGEFGDEVLGDPVSQLHKIALQIVHHENIMAQQAQQAESHFQNAYYFNMSPAKPPGSDSMMPQMTKGPVTYLACLNDLVGTHKTNDKRTPMKGLQFNTSAAIAAAAAASECYNFTASSLSATLNSNASTRKRRVSMMDDFGTMQQMQVYNSDLDTMNMRRRVSSLNDSQRYQTSSPHMLGQRSHSVSAPSSSPFQDRSAAANRKNSLLANGGQALAEFGAYWSEDVTDAAVWTIVGTECARYTFWAPPYLDENKQQESQITAPLSTPFPCLTHFVISNDGYNNGEEDYSTMMTVSGENFTRDLQIWFGDIKAPFTEYRSREMLVCRLPSREELLQSVGLNRVHDVPIQETTTNDHGEGQHQPRLPYSIRILLIRGDGVVYKTSRSYSFS